MEEAEDAQLYEYANREVLLYELNAKAKRLSTKQLKKLLKRVNKTRFFRRDKNLQQEGKND